MTSPACMPRVSISPRRRFVSAMTTRSGRVTTTMRQRSDRALDLLAEGVAEPAPLRAGVDGFDGEVLRRLLICEDVADGVGGVDGEERDLLALGELQGDRGGARSLADAALAGEEEHL